MLRLFETSTKRDIKELSQKWRLMPDFDNSGDKNGYANGIPTDARYTFVPSCWNFELDLFHHYGTTWYETEFDAPSIDAREKAYLKFDAVDCFATYFVNGKEIGKSENAFIEHEFEVTDVIKVGKNT